MWLQSYYYYRPTLQFQFSPMRVSSLAIKKMQIIRCYFHDSIMYSPCIDIFLLQRYSYEGKNTPKACVVHDAHILQSRQGHIFLTKESAGR